MNTVLENPDTTVFMDPALRRDDDFTALCELRAE
jgi:hypothetical protein